MDKVSRTAPAPDRTEGPARGRPRPWLLPAGLLLVLAVLTINVLVHGPLVTMDQHIRQTVQGWAHAVGWRWLADSPHAPAQLITDLGRATVAVPVLAVVAAVLAVRGHTPRPLLVAAAGVALLLVTVIPAKVIIARPGPGNGAVAAGSLGYFPSGHTSTACVCYSIAVFLLVAGARPGPPGRPGWPGRGVVAGRRRAGLVQLSLGHRRAGGLGAVRAHRLAGAARPAAAQTALARAPDLTDVRAAHRRGNWPAAIWPARSADAYKSLTCGDPVCAGAGACS